MQTNKRMCAQLVDPAWPAIAGNRSAQVFYVTMTLNLKIYYWCIQVRCLNVCFEPILFFTLFEYVFSLTNILLQMVGLDSPKVYLEFD